MTAVDLAVVLTGLVLIAVLARYFFAPRTAPRALVEGGRQVVDVHRQGRLLPESDPGRRGHPGTPALPPAGEQ